MTDLLELQPGMPSVVTVGVFDGVHLGHQTIMRIVKEESRKHSARSVVVTFERNPAEIIDPSRPVPFITTLPQKLELIREQGMDLTVVLPPDLKITNMSAEDFARAILKERLSAVRVVVGEDFRFGRGRAGNVDSLREMGERLGFRVTGVPAVRVGRLKVSSTEIRQRIAAGDMETANKLLGHLFTLRGVVVRGKGVGRDLGFPTANIQPAFGQLVPPSGVYVVTVTVSGKPLHAVSNIGNTPTVGSRETVVEVHIPGFSGELYGQELDVAFHTRLREERKFPSLDDLKRQIAADVEKARESFAHPQ